MAPWPFNLLSDTGDHPAIESLSSDSLAKMGEEPATELFVRQMHENCWVKRWVRRFRMDISFAMGMFFALQLTGYFLIRAAVFDLRATMRADVLKILEEKHLGAAGAVSPAAFTTTQGETP